MLYGVLAVFWSCAQIARADFTYGTPAVVPNVNSPFDDSGVSISRDGLELYFFSDRPPHEGQCYMDLWVSKRSTPHEPWPAPGKLPPPVNSNGPEGSPCISADGLELYFSDGWPGLYTSNCTPNPKGYGAGDLWVSRRATKADAWGDPANLGPLINTASGEDQPCLSADGLSLYFMSNTAGGYGNTDLYVTTRKTLKDPWSSPVNLGPNINTWSYETCPFISPDGLSLYFSRGTTTTDIYVSHRPTAADPWGMAVLFNPVNSGKAEYYFSFSENDSTLYFTRGDDTFAGSSYDLWQIQVLPILDFNEDGKVDEKDYLALTQHWGQNDSRYDIGPMGWGDGVVDAKDQRVFLETMEGRDFTLNPSLDASEVALDPVLEWTAPQFAKACDVYFGTSFVFVSAADRASPLGVLVSQVQTPTTYKPQGLLEYGRTYYWRVDFVSAGPNPAIYKGPVLSFTTAAYPIKSVIATASSSQPGMGPEKTIDGSGLDKNDGHSASGTDMWLSTGVPPNWIQYQFDKVYALRELWVWNSNQLMEPFLGFGAKSVKIEYSTDGTTWTPLASVPEFARAPGAAGYTPNTIVSFGGAKAQYVKLTINSTWGGMSPITGLSEVRFFYVPE